MVPFEGLPTGVSLSWQVHVTSPKVETPTELAKAYHFYHPAGVAVDHNPNSENYGRVLVTECMNPVPNSKYSYQSEGAGDGQGLYAFDPQLNPIKNAAGTYAFKGGLTFESTLNGTTNTAYDPRKVRITDDGRIFITRQASQSSALYEVNPADLNTAFSEVFKGTIDPETYLLKDSEGKFIAGANVSLDVKGSGDDLKLLMLSTNKAGIGYAASGYSTDEYALGKATTWSTVPSKNIDWLTGQFTVSATSASVVYDNEGGMWYIQYRATPTDEQPALLHVNAAGTEDYRALTSNMRAGGIRFNNDFTLLAMSDASKQIGVYKVGKDEAGKPTLTVQYQFATNIGSNCNDMAWDNANNLYIVGNSGEWLKVFALPRDVDFVCTPAMAKYAFQVATPPAPEAYTLTQDVKITEGLPAVAEARQAAFVNGKLYIQNKADKKVEIWTKDGKTTETLESGAGTNITSDEAGNVIVRIGAFPNKFVNDESAELRIYPAAGGTPVDVTLSSIPEGRIDFFGKVKGNVLDTETGGIMYLCPTGATGTTVVPIIGGKQDVDGTYNATLENAVAADGGTIAYPCGDMLIYNKRNAGNTIRMYEVSGETYTDKGALNTPKHYAANGSNVFTMAGVDYIVYPTSDSKAYKDGFAIAKVSTDAENTALVEYKETFASASNSYQGNWLFPQVISDTQAKIYQYCPGGMIAVYTFTAPVSKVKLYVIGEAEENDYTWAANKGYEMIESDTKGVYTTVVTLQHSATDTKTKASFGFATKLGATDADWETLNANRYGSSTDGTLVMNAVETALEKAKGAFTISSSKYGITVDLNTMKFTCTDLNPVVPLTYTLKELGKITEGIPTSADARQAVVANGNLYIQNKAEGVVEIWNAQGKKTTETLASGKGTNIAKDQAGNIIVRIGTFPNNFASDAAELRIFPATGGDPVDVTLTGIPEGRCDFFGTIEGNVLDATDGGTLYLTNNGIAGVYMVHFVGGKQDVDNCFAVSLPNASAADGSTIAYPYGEKLVYNRRGAGNSIRVYSIVNEVPVDEGALVTPDHNASNGSSVFTMGGIDYIAYPTTQSASYKDGFAIAKVSTAEDNAKLVEHAETLAANANGFQSNWVFANVVSDTRAIITQYCPGGMIAQYLFTTEDLTTAPTELYVVGSDKVWNPSVAAATLAKVDGKDGIYEGSITPLVQDDTKGLSFFTISSMLGADANDWSTFNTHRFGATTVDHELVSDVIDHWIAGGDNSFAVKTDGTFVYKVMLNIYSGTIMVTKTSGVTDVTPVAKVKVIGNVGEINVIGEANSIEVYNMNGALISKGESTIPCASGVYIVKVDGATVKVAVK